MTKKNTVTPHAPSVSYAVAALLAALLLTACAVPRPLALHHPIEGQRLLRSVSHWRTAANDLASVAGSALPAQGRLLIVPARPSTTFSDNFERLLETRLIQMGYQVERLPAQAPLPAPGEAAVLRLRHEVVELHADTESALWSQSASDRTGAAGLAAYALAKYWDWHADAAMAAGVGAGLASGWIGPPTPLEMVTTVNLQTAGTQWQDMRIAYIDPGDRHLYERRLPTLSR